jgi:hypothetical protein
MRWFEPSSSVLAAAALLACGGPPVGSKVPRPDPTPIAVGAAAAATALTLANPNLAGQKTNEADDGREPRESREPRQDVPMDVLDRAEAGESDTEPDRPCKTPAAKPGISLVPSADETRPRTAPKNDEPCKQAPPPDPGSSEAAPTSPPR